MPIKKKKISELTLADSLKGLYTIGYKVVDGVKTSVKVGLEYIQAAYEDVVKATNDAKQATTDVRELEATVEENEESRKSAESQRMASEQSRQTQETERQSKENERITAETGRVNAEKARVTEFDGIKSAAETATQSANEAAFNTNEAIQNAKTATDAANASASSANQATENANTAASNANSKATLADTAAANANDTAEHPTYIGEDHYVYKWNKTAKAYDKTDIYTKGDAFSIKKVYASVAELEADKGNPDIAEGDFVLVNTGDVEDPDNAKLYVKADGNYEFLVDMSGAIGFTGKTPQFSMGTVTTLEAGASATATVSSDGTDEGGNPKYKLNFAIPRGNPGAPFKPVGQYDTLELLKQAIPDGSAVDGFMAVGTEAPYDYYAWVNGDWVNQGKIAGGGSGNVVVIPSAAMSLSDQATSDDIFNAFGGKDAFMDICQSIVNKDTVCVVANIPEESGMKLVYIPIMAMATYTDANNANFMMAIITETTFQLVVTVTDGVATQSSQVLNHIYEAPSNGNVYGRKNKDWVEVPEKSDVLTKNNETEYTPTKPYHPATKKYVDDKILVRNVDGTILNKWINNTVITGETVQGLVNELFGNFISFAEDYAEGRYRGLRFSARHYDEEAGNYFGYIINANIQYCLSELGNGYFELLFTFGYGSTLKSCYIYYYDVSETSSENKIVITDVVRSDNLTTLTKKTAAEYEALGSKDANTAYCVTD
ncbi:phage upper tail fiber protein [Bacteroides gallinarum]|uniref:phage upper tail fiber protein n=1 Tax=Bacteroides gallinarum TaxID=376806 RepID=UPI000379C9EF|nr:hypothetical protein [Bacteroides gallinarum]